MRIIVAFDFDTDSLATAYGTLMRGLARYNEYFKDDTRSLSQGWESVEWWDPGNELDCPGSMEKLCKVSTEYWKLNIKDKDNV